jgi:hypothetical protein
MSGFVVRVTGNRGNFGWLSGPDFGLVPSKIVGLSSRKAWRTFVPRESAEVFTTREAAQEAFLPMLKDDFHAGIVFSIELADAMTD